jgi:glucose/arabinose dehydrogenase
VKDHPSSSRILAFAGALSLALPALATPPARTQLLTSAVPFPICIASTPVDPQHIYVCGRMGTIRIIDKDTGAATPGFFLNISAQVSVQQDNGLLGLVFDPDYDTNGFFYVNYRHIDGNIVLARYHVNPGATAADPDSAYTILRYARNLGHNGGWIGFSPINNLLYITSGDGDLGGTLDFAGNAQNIVNTFYGKILRIDPHSDDFPDDPDRNYHIPPSNPFVDQTGDDEIWAYGLRNPWRASFDRTSGTLYFGDVGMDSWEEVDAESPISPGGRNYGWPCMEGTHCTGSTQCVCGDAALTDPVYDYSHSIGGSVIGGYVYRGTAIPEFEGLYFFGDFLRAKIWSFRPVGDEGIAEFVDRTTDFIPPGTARPISYISTFGEDVDGELYVADIYDSKVYKIVPYPCLPSIDTLPATQSHPERSTFALSVAGSGGDPLTFQWRLGTTDLTDGGRIQGSSTATLTISNAQVPDTGEYSVVLTSPCGNTVSDGVLVTVFACVSADFDRSGVIAIDDLFAYLAAWFAGSPSADFNNNSTLEVQDIFDYLTAWFINCP